MTVPQFPPYINAIELTKALSLGSWYGTYGVARCPAHDDRRPSLSIRQAESGCVLLRCHAGCRQEDIIGALRARGLWAQNSKRLLPAMAGCRSIKPKPDHSDAKRTQAALAIWRSSKRAAGTPVEFYLDSRGLDLPTLDTLRFHPGLRHPSGGVWPAMVALVTNGVSGAPIAIHRTFLIRDGHGKAPIEPQKMMLGPCQSGVVRLSAESDVLMVGEGIETCLAAMLATRHPAWAALSNTGLRALHLPQNVRDVIVLADGDEAGETAAQDCAQRWTHERRRVRIAYPPKGLDFNDLLLGGAPDLLESEA